MEERTRFSLANAEMPLVLMPMLMESCPGSAVTFHTADCTRSDTARQLLELLERRRGIGQDCLADRLLRVGRRRRPDAVRHQVEDAVDNLNRRLVLALEVLAKIVGRLQHIDRDGGLD